MGEANYHQITPPDDKSREEYTYAERRAAILRIIEKRGHPWGLNKTQLGREFGVTDAQIHHDLDKLKDYYSKRIGKDAKTTSELAYKRIIKDHLENDELAEARKALDSWNEWLQDTGHQEKEPDKVDVGGDGIVFNFQEPDESE